MILILANSGAPGKWPLKWRERERERERETYGFIGSHSLYINSSKQTDTPTNSGN